jgi:sterol desaturase/sphingolipid hydroxylase (fatty acid hydroxylase superfamily)
MRSTLHSLKYDSRITPIGWYAAGVLLLGGLSYVGFLLTQTSGTGGQTLLSQLKVMYETRIHGSLLRQINTSMGIFLSPYFYIGVISVFILEHLMPAKKDQRVFSSGLFQDITWFILNNVPMLTFVFVYGGLLNFIYRKHLGFLTIESVSTWPEAYRLTMAVFITDFLSWLHHLIRHKVSLLWLFHTVHHSQRELNLFTDHRVHFIEIMIAHTIFFIPQLMLQANISHSIYLMILINWYTRIYHANLKTNYGFLKYFMVTPQSHRVHHSIEEKHWDKNFGVLFTIWDRIFGTLYKNYDEYPDTGISDARFPLERKVKGLHGVMNYWAQNLYPFRLALQKKS